MTDTPDLRDQIAHDFDVSAFVERLVSDEHDPEAPQPRSETLAGFRRGAEAAAEELAPLLAAERADLRIRRNALADALGLPASDDERGSDFYALVQRVADLLAAKDTENAELRSSNDKAWTVAGQQQRNFEDCMAAMVEMRHWVARLTAERDEAVLEMVRERDEARAEVDKLRSDLTEALAVAERAARDTGTRHPLADVESDLAGLAAREATTHPTPEGEHPCADSAPSTRTTPSAPAPATAASASAAPEPEANTPSSPKPRRDERINPAGLYTEPTDHGGA